MPAREPRTWFSERFWKVCSSIRHDCAKDAVGAGKDATERSPGLGDPEKNRRDVRGGRPYHGPRERRAEDDVGGRGEAGIQELLCPGRRGSLSFCDVHLGE